MAASAKANHPRRSLCARRVIDPDPTGPESLDRASPSSLLRMTALPFQHAAGVESGCRFRKCKSQKCSRSNLSGMDPVRTLAVITSPHVFISVESKGGYVQVSPSPSRNSSLTSYTCDHARGRPPWLRLSLNDLTDFSCTTTRPRQREDPFKFYKRGSQEKTHLHRPEFFLLLSPLDRARFVLTYRTMCSVSRPCDPAVWVFTVSGFHRFFATKPFSSETSKAERRSDLATIVLSGTRGP